MFKRQKPAEKFAHCKVIAAAEKRSVKSLNFYQRIAKEGLRLFRHRRRRDSRLASDIINRVQLVTMIRIASFVILLMPCSRLTLAGPARPEIDIAVKFDRTFYKLELGDGGFLYREGPLTYRMKATPCNRVILVGMRGKFMALKVGSSVAPAKGKSEFDVQVTASGDTVDSVPRGSKFGTWLRELPKTIGYFAADMSSSCKR